LWRTRVGRAFYSLLILSAASLFISSAFSDDPRLSLAGTVWRRLGAINQTVMLFIAAAIAAYVYMDRKAARTTMLAMEAAGAIASAYGIAQYAGWDPLIPAKLYTLGSPPAVRPPATLTQATVFATFLLAPILIAAWFRLHESSSRWKRAHEIALFLTISALFLSGTRSALLGLAAGASVLLYLERPRIVQRKTLARAGVGLLAFAATAAIFVMLPAGEGVRARFTQWAGDRAGGPRLLVWRDSLPLLWRHPVLGIGPEMFEGEFRRIESMDLARAYPDHYHESPHNFFLEVAIGQGLLGLALWLGLLSVACWSGLSCFRRGDSDTNPVLSALIATIISLQFCPLTTTNELYLLMLCGMLVGSFALRAPAETHSAAWSPALTWCWRAAGVALVAIASAHAAQTTLYALAESRAFHRNLAGARELYEAGHRFPMPAPNLELSRQCALVAQHSGSPDREQAFALGMKAAESAERGSAERFDALYQSGMLAIMTGDLPQAQTKLRAAVDCSPTWYRPRMALASVLWWQGRDHEAEREAARASDCAGRLEPYVKRTLAAARAQASLMASRHALQHSNR
jgi:O-antigen ligase